jgi:hypothetical protein
VNGSVGEVVLVAVRRAIQAVIGAVWLLSSLAWGGDDELQARDLFKNGVELLRNGEFAPALDHFERAYEHWRNPKILLNIATTLRQLDRLPEAADTYELYLADPGADPAKSEEVRRALAEIDARLGRLVIDAGAGAVVMLDGRRLERERHRTTKDLVRMLPLGEANPGRWRVRVTPGEHEVEVLREGFTSRTVRVTLSAGEERAVAVALDPTQAHVSPPMAVDNPAPEDLSHGGQVGLVARADVDGKMRGAVAALGASYGLGSVVELQAAGLVGRDKGAELGAAFYLLRGTWKPMAYVGVPVFFVEGVSPGVHGALGLQADPSRSLGAFLQVGVATFMNVPEDRDATVFVPSAGIQGRL